MRHAIVDMIRNEEPTSVLGVLVQWHGRDRLTVEAVAGLLSKPVAEVEWTVDMLEAEDLCVRYNDEGISYVTAFAAYSERNS